MGRHRLNKSEQAKRNWKLSVRSREFAEALWRMRGSPTDDTSLRQFITERSFGVFTPAEITLLMEKVREHFAHYLANRLHEE